MKADKRPKNGQAPKLRGNEAAVGVEVVVINNTKARAKARAKFVVVVAVVSCLPHVVLVAVDVATTRVVGSRTYGSRVRIRECTAHPR